MPLKCSYARIDKTIIIDLFIFQYKFELQTLDLVWPDWIKVLFIMSTYYCFARLFKHFQFVVAVEMF